MEHDINFFAQIMFYIYELLRLRNISPILIFRYTLNEERIYLLNDNKNLKKQIHNFCKCLDCPALPMIPQRAGKIPCTDGKEMMKKRRTHNGKRSNESGNIPSIR